MSNCLISNPLHTPNRLLVFHTQQFKIASFILIQLVSKILDTYGSLIFIEYLAD